MFLLLLTQNIPRKSNTLSICVRLRLVSFQNYSIPTLILDLSLNTVPPYPLLMYQTHQTMMELLSVSLSLHSQSLTLLALLTLMGQDRG